MATRHELRTNCLIAGHSFLCFGISGPHLNEPKCDKRIANHNENPIKKKQLSPKNRIHAIEKSQNINPEVIAVVLCARPDCLTQVLVAVVS